MRLAYSFCTATILLFSFSTQSINAIAQPTDAERKKEIERLNRVDPPVRPDPLGNALIGGAVTGSMKGAAAGAASASRGAALGTGLEKIKEPRARDPKDTK